MRVKHEGKSRARPSNHMCATRNTRERKCVLTGSHEGVKEVGKRRRMALWKRENNEVNITRACCANFCYQESAYAHVNMHRYNLFV
mmetsp:Transcript_35816/g.93361  ORF Transcript_35816/g.93361 Transcript_35816/m.93361 type:complete len:86 (+) Transcript_35816:76-333(+)